MVDPYRDYLRKRRAEEPGVPVQYLVLASMTIAALVGTHDRADGEDHGANLEDGSTAVPVPERAGGQHDRGDGEGVGAVGPHQLSGSEVQVGRDRRIEVTVTVMVKKLIAIPRQAITTAHHGLRW